MTGFRVLERGDMARLLEDKSLENIKSAMTDNAVSQLESSKYAFTLLVDDKPIACIGISEYWPGRGEAWAFFTKDKPEYFVRIHRAAKRFLKKVDMNRIEATVRCSFYQGHRWAMMLGFECERTEMKFWGPTGESYSAYAYLKGVK